MNDFTRLNKMAHENAQNATILIIVPQVDRGFTRNGKRHRYADDVESGGYTIRVFARRTARQRTTRAT